MSENELSAIVVDIAVKLHAKFGPGLHERVYSVVMAHELRKRGLRVEREVPVPIRYENLIFEEGFVADIIIEEKLILELKVVECLTAIHRRQLLTYLRLRDVKLGLLLNFGECYMKDGIVRIVNGLEDERQFPQLDDE